MIYTIITVDTHCRNINIIKIIRINLQSTSDKDGLTLLLKASKGNNLICIFDHPHSNIRNMFSVVTDSKGSLHLNEM